MTLSVRFLQLMRKPKQRISMAIAHRPATKRLQAVGSELYSTAEGDITVTTNGTEHSISATS